MQLIRSIQILQDYKLHGVLNRRYHASKKSNQIEGDYLNIHIRSNDLFDHTELSEIHPKALY